MADVRDLLFFMVQRGDVDWDVDWDVEWDVDWMLSGH